MENKVPNNDPEEKNPYQKVLDLPDNEFIDFAEGKEMAKNAILWRIKNRVLTKEETLDVLKKWGIPARYNEEKKLVELFDDRDNDNPNVVEVIGIEPPHASRYKDVMAVIEIYIEK